MRIERINQCLFKDVKTAAYDLVLVASGYETRARFVAEAIGETAARRVAWGFVEQSGGETRRNNDSILKSLKYDIQLLKEGATETAAGLLTQELQHLKWKSNAVLIDISSMTRAWYGGIVRALSKFEASGPIRVCFTYTTAGFVRPETEYPPNEVMGPVAGFSSLALPDKPTALIIGLGHDPDRALGIKDHLDPQMTLLFRAEPGADPRYSESVEAANHDLIEIVGRGRLFNYPLRDCVATYKLVESACRGLIRDWRLVLCSLGPKMFGLISFLLATYYDEISIWRVSACARGHVVDHKPGAEPLGFDVWWNSNETRTDVWYPAERGIEPARIQ